METVLIVLPVFILCALVILLYITYIMGYNAGWRERERQYLPRESIRRILAENGCQPKE